MPLAAVANELGCLLRLAAPMSCIQLCYTLLMPTTLAFCGSLGTEQLDAAALAVSIYQLTVETCGTAMRWGLMPFLAQTMGGSKKLRVGYFVQRGLLAAAVLVCINWSVAVNSANLLVLLGQDPGIAVHCEQYLLILMPGSLAMIVAECLVAYTDTLGCLWPALVCRFCVLFSNAGLHLLLVTHLQLGLLASAASVSGAFCLTPLLQSLLIWRWRLAEGTWPGFSCRALVDWRKFFVTLLPCLATQTLWTFGSEVGNFLAGVMGKSELAAESVLFQVNMVAFLLAMGGSSAIISRVGRHLGSGRAADAVRAVRVSCVVMATLGCAAGIAIFLLRHQVPKLFSLDPEAEQLFVRLSPLLACYTAMQIAASAPVSTLRACSFHTQTMVMNLVAYYAISLPVGASLAFAASWGLDGLWVGFLLAAGVFFLAPTLYLLRVDWRLLADTHRGTAEAETDVEALAERRPLLQSTATDQLSQSAPSSAAAAAAGRGRTCFSATAKRFGVFAGAALLLLAAVLLRLCLPQPAAGSGHNGTASLLH